jgi:DNA polymerase
MRLPPELREELRALTASVRAHLEAEAELGAAGLHVSATTAHLPASAQAPRCPAPASRQAPHVPDQRRVPAAAPSQAPRAPVPALPHASPPPLSTATAALLEGASDRRARLQLLADAAASCTACVLHEKRNRTVFARGSPDAELVFVGEGPGRDEDAQGLPFVGAAGQLLDRMIAAMGYGRDDVYICNVVKCRPPENRTPRPEEAIACAQFLVPQLELVAPKAIVALGRCAAQALGVAGESGPWRGKWGSWRGVAILPTYHPAYLLRSPEFKRTVWEDLQQVMRRLGRTPARPGT